MNVDTFMDRPTHRRAWLLVKGLECAPLNQAIELARKAECFVLGKDFEADPAVVENEMVSPPLLASTSELAEPAAAPEAAQPSPGRVEQQARAVLEPAQRDELVQRAAKGATNAELAIHFGLTPRQVQGVRMGAARAKLSAGKGSQPLISAAIEDVVRYLRQQDDVVVSDGHGGFLVNGRFKMSPAELVAKANRARGRQKKPPFALEGRSENGMPRTQRNGHPMFWPSENDMSH